ncbi:MAG: T9SS type A sorting domain-containing protein [Bacteroidales bacterium]|nr:T9SS type A sorting domain-containing protein [Bacteroidales bacterium]
MKNLILLGLVLVSIITNKFIVAQEYDWIQMTSSITYKSDGITEQSRYEFAYDTEGREIGSRFYSMGEKAWESRNYQYNGQTVVFWIDSYVDGSVNTSTKCKRTYKEQTGSSIIIEAIKNPILIYPNPTKDDFIIGNNELIVEKVEIFDINGEKLLSTFNRKIKIAHLPSGTYFIKIQTDKGELSRKIIKE